MRITISSLAMVAALAAVACSGSSDTPPAQVAGNYTLTVTDDQNGCNVENFTTNASQTGITVTITQSGSSVSATVTSSSGLVLAFSAGDTLSGTIEGSFASLTTSASRQQGNCAYSATATANMQFDGDQVHGHFLYTDSGNGSPDCGVMQQCTSTQNFTGSRGPT
jgi:hypothetical protein